MSARSELRSIERDGFTPARIEPPPPPRLDRTARRDLAVWLTALCVALLGVLALIGSGP